MPAETTGPAGGGGGSALRSDLLAFSVARQAALGQEEFFKLLHRLQREIEPLTEQCKTLGQEVVVTQAENKQLASHISRVLGLVTSFTQAQASSNNEVRSVLTAQVLALTEHVSALTKQFTLFQLDQRDRQQRAQQHERPPPLPSLCDAYIATCDRVRVTPSGAALCSLTADCESITLDLRDLRELWALVETLKHHHASLHQQKQPLSGKGLKTEAEAAAAAAAAPVLARMSELLSAMDDKASRLAQVAGAAKVDAGGTAAGAVAAAGTSEGEEGAAVPAAAGGSGTGAGIGTAVAGAESEPVSGGVGGLQAERLPPEVVPAATAGDATSGGLGGGVGGIFAARPGEAAGESSASPGGHDVPGASATVVADSRRGDAQPTEGGARSAPAQARGSAPAPAPSPPPPPTGVRHLRLVGDVRLCTGAEAQMLLESLLRAGYPLSTLELPHRPPAGDVVSAEEALAEDTLAAALRRWESEWQVHTKRVPVSAAQPP
eukprot:COSAG01_NODE_858_length_13069_cov_23.641943_7_plen_492_part_00